MNFFKQRIRSFAYAFSGLYEAVKSEMHMKFHLFASVLVIAAGFYFSVTKSEFLVILICIALVISLELINTAIEHLCNKLMPDTNANVKYIKDVSAGAVLVASIIAMVIGLIIFWPYLGVT
jgi:diacylglycerol kinase